MNELKTLAVFCGSSVGTNVNHAEHARTLARVMTDKNIALVYGGGNRGLMGIIAETLHEAGMGVTGVMPQALYRSDVYMHKVEDSLIVVPTMHERKARMYELADGFVALPGGIGTYEELFEVYTWLQLGYHHKPVGILNSDGFYDSLLQFLSHSCEEGFLHKAHLDALVVESDPVTLLERMHHQDTHLADKLNMQDSGR